MKRALSLAGVALLAGAPLVAFAGVDGSLVGTWTAQDERGTRWTLVVEASGACRVASEMARRSSSERGTIASRAVVDDPELASRLEEVATALLEKKGGPAAAKPDTPLAGLLDGLGAALGQRGPRPARSRRR